MRGWLKTLIGAMCMITILLYLVPNGKFVKYVRFYGGIVFLLLACGPILGFFSGEGELERFLQLEFLKEEHYEIETAVEGMADLKNNVVMEAYQQELYRQIGEIVTACGFSVYELSLSFAEDGYSLTGVSACISAGEGSNASVSRVRSEISGIYMLSERDIQITQKGAVHETMD